MPRSRERFVAACQDTQNPQFAKLFARKTGIVAGAALAISAAPAVAGDFGPGKSDKGPHDPGALCHPPGQTADCPPCK